MISDRQLEANRRNALHSTGPQTPEGRAAVRNNAVTHALTAQNAVLPDESKEEFDEFFAAFEAEYQPAGPTETLLLTQIVMDAWRLQRIRSMETAFFELAMRDYSKFFAEEHKNATPDKFHAYIFREDARGSDVLSRLGRYESRIQRNFYRSLHELQRLQARRATSSISTPDPAPPAPAPDLVNTPPDPGPHPSVILKNQTHSQNRTLPPLPVCHSDSSQLRSDWSAFPNVPAALAVSPVPISRLTQPFAESINSERGL